MPSPIACICFDLDDTLWPVSVVITRAENAMHEWLHAYYPRLAQRFSPQKLRQMREKLLAEQPHLSCDFSTIRQLTLAEAAQQVGYSPDFVEQALEIFLTARHEVTLYHDVLPTLKKLHGQYQLCTLTNGNADVARLHFAEWFCCNIQAHHIGVAKPSPEPFLAICEQLQLRPEQVLHIGDDARCDVEGALTAGMQAIWLNRSKKPWPGQSPAPLTIRSLSELVPLLARWTETAQQSQG